MFSWAAWSRMFSGLRIFSLNDIFVGIVWIALIIFSQFPLQQILTTLKPASEIILFLLISALLLPREKSENAYLPALIAFAAGIYVTSWAILPQLAAKTSEEGTASILEEWARHFGPELIVLGFAALVVERAIQRRERRNTIRQRLIDDLSRQFAYADEHRLFFTGDDIWYWERENNTLRHVWLKREHGLNEFLTKEERALFYKMLGNEGPGLESFLVEARSFAAYYHLWNTAKAQIGTWLWEHNATESEKFESLHKHATEALLLTPLVTGPKSLLSEIQPSLGAVLRSITAFKTKLAALGPDDTIIEAFDEYEKSFRILRRIKYGKMIRGYAGALENYSEFRNKVWAISDPYRPD